ncbi:hypothetical protein EWT52_07905 [Escherichia coli O25b:H4]|nr:hypothetical protein EWT52_07905 [Escherichia coli O25b:H4]
MFVGRTLVGKRITVVGGGQSGADLFLNALRGEWGEAAEINWVSRRNNFNALDEAALLMSILHLNIFQASPDWRKIFASVTG